MRPSELLNRAAAEGREEEGRMGWWRQSRNGTILLYCHGHGLHLWKWRQPHIRGGLSTPWGIAGTLGRGLNAVSSLNRLSSLIHCQHTCTGTPVHPQALSQPFHAFHKTFHATYQLPFPSLDIMSICNFFTHIQISYIIYHTVCHLTLNLKKSCQCIFLWEGKQKKSLFKIDQEEIEEVNDFKFLSFILDSKSKFDKHVKKLCKTVNATLKCFRMMRWYIQYLSRQLFMQALIFSLMDQK